MQTIGALLALEILAIQVLKAVELDPTGLSHCAARDRNKIAGARRSKAARGLCSKAVWLGGENGSDRVATSRINGKHEHVLALAFACFAVKVVAVVAPDLARLRGNGGRGHVTADGRGSVGVRVTRSKQGGAVHRLLTCQLAYGVGIDVVVRNREFVRDRLERTFTTSPHAVPGAILFMR